MDRRCGECNLCCTLVPVKGLGKAAGVRCQHQRGLGCNIYHKQGFPIECGLWSCRWLADDSTAALARPDQSHFVIDIVPDFVTTQVGDQKADQPVIQLWCDPRFPDAHRDPAFREWVVKSEPRCCVLVRLNSADAILLIPPHMSDTGDWEEIGNNRMQLGEDEHRAHEIAAVLANAGAMK